MGAPTETGGRGGHVEGQRPHVWEVEVCPREMQAQSEHWSPEGKDGSVGLHLTDSCQPGGGGAGVGFANHVLGPAARS